MSDVLSTSDSSFAADTTRDGIVIVDFWAPWCPPCRAVAPVLDAFAAQHKNSLTVMKLNVDENPIASAQHDIRSIPTLKVFENGRVVKTVVGAVSRRELDEALTEYLH